MAGLWVGRCLQDAPELGSTRGLVRDHGTGWQAPVAGAGASGWLPPGTAVAATHAWRDHQWSGGVASTDAPCGSYPGAPRPNHPGTPARALPGPGAREKIARPRAYSLLTTTTGDGSDPSPTTGDTTEESMHGFEIKRWVRVLAAGSALL